MKTTLLPHRKLRRRSDGYTLIEIMIVMVIVAGLLTGAVVAYQKVLDRSHDYKAATLQEDFTNWYTNWTHAGGTHNSATTNPGSMAYFLLNKVAGSPASDAGIAKAPDADGNWAEETRMKVGGKSLAGAIRLDLTKPYTLDTATNTVLFDSGWDVTFNPTESNKGTWTVVYRR